MILLGFLLGKDGSNVPQFSLSIKTFLFKEGIVEIVEACMRYSKIKLSSKCSKFRI